MADNSAVRVGIVSRLAVLMAEKDPQLTQKELSRITGICTFTLGQLYKRAPIKAIHGETILTLCQFFNCGVGELLTIKEIEPSTRTTKRGRPPKNKPVE